LAELCCNKRALKSASAACWAGASLTLAKFWASHCVHCGEGCSAAAHAFAGVLVGGLPEPPAPELLELLELLELHEILDLQHLLELEERKEIKWKKEKKEIPGKTNKATYLLVEQSAQLTDLKRKGLLTEFEHSDLEKMIQAFYDYQGAAERIKTFPFPRQYGYFSQVFVSIFIFLLPFGLVSVIADNSSVWLTIPASLLISWIFQTMGDVGDSSENPFENGLNDVPLTAICRVIEIDLKEMLGEDDIPEKLKPINHVLM